MSFTTVKTGFHLHGLTERVNPVVLYSLKIKMQTIKNYGWSAALFAELALKIKNK